MANYNFNKWFRAMRHMIAHSSTAVWGRRRSIAPGQSSFVSGTGTLLEIHGCPIVMTCFHVLEPIDDDVMFATGRLTEQRERVHSHRVYDESIDLGAAILNDRFCPGDRRFVSASDAVLQNIDRGEPVIVYGFPMGHRKIQVGAKVSADERKAWFKSMTYLSVIGYERYNTALQGYFPTIEWLPASHPDMVRILQVSIPAGEDIDRRGFSGGPVFLANSRKLIGHVTHVRQDGDKSFFFVPIARSLDSLSKRINTVYELKS
ncbi:trypsin-like peptidase domain-containing protein [Chondromyces crocatus]|uniref:Serine protease n=1 Tax=Chondromyces crocatus TaxID=52 RepID=A0A0K1EFS2_CHOCO|nr:trypsin-like peptidase domain-containing protein [Chondromyces crocatus]AKT39716.1 uncharacterized protein CMC5_038650 [Chondromyces crocatus]